MRSATIHHMQPPSPRSRKRRKPEEQINALRRLMKRIKNLVVRSAAECRRQSVERKEVLRLASEIKKRIESLD